jgi:hypothetical protein
MLGRGPPPFGRSFFGRRALLIVKKAASRIRQNSVRFIDLFEFRFGELASRGIDLAQKVRVVELGQLLPCRFYLGGAGRFTDSQYLVIRNDMVHLGRQTAGPEFLLGIFSL